VRGGGELRAPAELEQQPRVRELVRAEARGERVDVRECVVQREQARLRLRLCPH
jgi:hypothetical protein